MFLMITISIHIFLLKFLTNAQMHSMHMLALLRIMSILMPKILFQYRLLLPYIRLLRLPHTPIGNNMSSHTLITPLEEKNGVGNTHLAAMKLRHF